MKLGSFTKTEDGNFEGQAIFPLLGKEIDLRIVRNTADKGPNYFVQTGGDDFEFGIGTDKKSRDGNPYILVKIDDPTLPSEIWCALNKYEDGYNLNWSRPRPQNDPSANGTQDTL